MDASSCYYSILNVDPSASPAAIVKAYRQLALKYHPDKNPDGGPEQFYSIQTAYEILSDPTTRKLYDIHGHSLKPDLAEALATLVPLLLSFTTGLIGSSIHAFGWVSSMRLVLGIEVAFMGLVGIRYCSLSSNDEEPLKRDRKPRETVTVSDYTIVTSFGLLTGHVTGWTSVSLLLFCRSLIGGH